METYYLIDYENVNSEGLSGCEQLGSTDHLLIFFTKNASKLDMSVIANNGSGSVKMLEVPAGRQSADMHIGSYLGYLAGSNEGRGIRVVIVSKDTGFDYVIRFWNARTDVKASRSETIGKAAPGKAAPAPKPGKAEAAKQSQATAPKPAALSKTAQEAALLLADAKTDPEIIKYIVALVDRHTGEKNGKQHIYQGIISKYGQKKGLETYQLIKKHI